MYVQRNIGIAVNIYIYIYGYIYRNIDMVVYIYIYTQHKYETPHKIAPSPWARWMAMAGDGPGSPSGGFIFLARWGCGRLEKSGGSPRERMQEVDGFMRWVYPFVRYLGRFYLLVLLGVSLIRIWAGFLRWLPDTLAKLPQTYQNSRPVRLQCFCFFWASCCFLVLWMLANSRTRTRFPNVNVKVSTMVSTWCRISSIHSM